MATPLQVETLCPRNTCPVCLNKLRRCELGKPEGCRHYFCLSCILEWSKNVNTCPVDRCPFNVIDVYSSLNGPLVRKIHVPNRRYEDVLTDPNDVTYCEICNQCNNEETLLLCDGCDKGYHTQCLTPSLSGIPEGNWYCEHCQPIVTSTRDVLQTDNIKFDNESVISSLDLDTESSSDDSVSWSINSDLEEDDFEDERVDLLHHTGLYRPRRIGSSSPKGLTQGGATSSRLNTCIVLDTDSEEIEYDEKRKNENGVVIETVQPRTRSKLPFHDLCDSEGELSSGSGPVVKCLLPKNLFQQREQHTKQVSSATTIADNIVDIIVSNATENISNKQRRIKATNSTLNSGQCSRSRRKRNRTKSNTETTNQEDDVDIIHIYSRSPSPLSTKMEHKSKKQQLQHIPLGRGVLVRKTSDSSLQKKPVSGTVRLEIQSPNNEGHRTSKMSVLKDQSSTKIQSAKRSSEPLSYVVSSDSDSAVITRSKNGVKKKKKSFDCESNAPSSSHNELKSSSNVSENIVSTQNRKRSSTKSRAQKKHKIAHNSKQDEHYVLTSPKSPGRKARTVATSSTSPHFRQVIRDAVIAHHQHDNTDEGLKVARKVVESALISPKKSPFSSLKNNVSLPKSSPGKPVTYKQYPSSPHPCRTSGQSVNVEGSSPKSLKPRALDFDLPTTTDYVGQIEKELKDLNATECLFNRDGTIVPLQTDPHLSGNYNNCNNRCNNDTKHCCCFVCTNKDSKKDVRKCKDKKLRKKEALRLNIQKSNGQESSRENGAPRQLHSSFDHNHDTTESRHTSTSKSKVPSKQQKSRQTTKQLTHSQPSDEEWCFPTDNNESHHNSYWNNFNTQTMKLREQKLSYSDHTGINGYNSTGSPRNNFHRYNFDYMDTWWSAGSGNEDIDLDFVMTSEFVTVTDSAPNNLSCECLHFVAPSTGQSIFTQKMALPPLPPLPSVNYKDSSLTQDLPQSNQESCQERDYSLNDTPARLTSENLLDSWLRAVNSCTEVSVDKTVSLKPLPFNVYTMCLLDRNQAAETVVRLLERHYVLGNINAEEMEKIRQRAVTKVQRATTSVPYERVRKLVDDYIIAYMNTRSHSY